MKYTYFILLCMLCSLNQCTTPDPVKDVKVLKVDLDTKANTSVFDIFSSIELIPLETNENSLIQEIWKVVATDSLYYIFDLRQSALLAFSHEGKFKFKIDRKGHGPGEYRELNDFQYNPYRNTLELLDPWGKLFEFTPEGQYLSTIQLPHPPAVYQIFLPLNQDSTLLYTFTISATQGNALRIYSRSQNKILSEFYNKPRYRYVGETAPLLSFENKTYFNTAAGNTVEEIQGGICQPVYQWDFTPYQITFPMEEVNQMKAPEKIESFIRNLGNSPEFPYVFLRNDQNEKYFHCTLYFLGKIINVFYPKKGDRYKVFHKTKEGMILNPVILTNQYLIGTLPLLHPVEDVIRPECLSKRDQEFLKHYSEDENPFLIKYNFK